MNKDSHKKSMLKSLVWRIMGVIVLATITYIFTRNWIQTTSITLIHHATFLIIYFIHERIWFKIKVEKKKLRRVLKAVTYEIILGMGIGGLIVLLVTGEWNKVTQITLTYTAVKLVMYYFYEKFTKH